MIDKELIKRNFSTYARYYDRYSSIQNLCALKLIDKINPVRSFQQQESESVPRDGYTTRGTSNGVNGDSFSNILEIGCGTGNYTKYLRSKFPSGRIKALDISREMVETAKKKMPRQQIEFIVADAETADFKELFDLITSNACFQWFEDLEKTLVKYSSLLAKNGVISFSIFGPCTYSELSASLIELYGRNISISAEIFIDKKRIKDILKKMFKKTIVEEETLREEHGSLLELLRKIKYTGTSGNGAKGKGFWTPRAMDRLEKIYHAKFGKIVSSHQIFFCQAVNPVRSFQQQESGFIMKDGDTIHKTSNRVK